MTAEAQPVRCRPGSVSVSVVTTNEIHWLPQCLLSLERQSHRDLEVIVVDNASMDGSAHLISREYPQYRLLRSDSNLGFCAAHNLAIRHARGEFVLVLNVDIALEPDFVETLVQAALRHPDAGMFSGKLLRMHARPSDLLPAIIDHTGFFPLRNGAHWDRGAGFNDSERLSQAGPVFGVTGAAAFYRMRALDDVRFQHEVFDESFYGYAEDVDLAWRLQIAGWTGWYEPAAVAWHARTATSSAPRRSRHTWTNWHLTKNRYLVWIKAFPGRVLLRNAPTLTSWAVAQLGYTAVFERSSLSSYVALARLVPSALRWRRHIYSQQRQSSKSLSGWYSLTDKMRSQLPGSGSPSLRVRVRQLFESTD